MRISDWSSDVCSSDLPRTRTPPVEAADADLSRHDRARSDLPVPASQAPGGHDHQRGPGDQSRCGHRQWRERRCARPGRRGSPLTEMTCRHEPQGIRTWPTTMSRRPSMCPSRRSEEHTSELQSLMRISYAVFCLKKKNNTKTKPQYNSRNTYNIHKDH